MEIFILRFFVGLIILFFVTRKNPPVQNNTPIINNTSTVLNQDGDSTPAAAATSPVLNQPAPTEVTPVVVDPDYLVTQERVIQNLIEREITANGYKINEISTRGMLFRKIINSLIFGLLSFICISFYFFHFPTWTYFLELIVIFVYIKANAKYSAKDFIYKEVKARPDEKVSNIVASLLAENIKDTVFTKMLRVIIVIIPFILICLVYYEPHFLYEKTDDGYHIRFYTIGINNTDEITVPDTHKGKPITGIRGNVFANLKTVRKITLPDTIKEIRGKAFKNDYLLEEVNLPAELTYLGGSAFYNCESLLEITIPAGVTEIQGGTFVNCRSLKVVNLHDDISYIHGESFINCESLETIKLPSKITEIRGNTFQGCSKLDNIEIPEGVTRIGGHAFEDCASLSNVKFPKTLQEIGSSGFRRCYSLRDVTIPQNTRMENNSFKESPTKINYFPSSSPSGSEYGNFTQYSLYLYSSATIYTKEEGIVEIELEGIRKVNSYTTEYTLLITTGESEREVTITTADQYKKITQNIEISAKASYGSSVDLSIYYN